MEKRKITLIIAAILTLMLLFIVYNIFAGTSKVQLDIKESANSGTVEKEVLAKLPKKSELVELSENRFERIKSFKSESGKEKLLVSYRNKESDNAIKMMVLEKNKAGWVEEKTLSIPGESIEEVIVEDISGDEKPEIIIGFKIKNSETRGLTVYSYRNNKLKNVYNDNYEKLFVDNFEDKGKKGIVLLKAMLEDDSYYLEYKKYTDEKIKTMDKVKVKNFKEKPVLRVGKIEEDKKYILMDYKLSDSKKVIKAYNVENDKFIEISALKASYSKEMDLLDVASTIVENRSKNIGTEDDKKLKSLEVAVSNEEFELDNENSDVVLVDWKKLNEDYDFETIRSQICDFKNNFTFEIPDYWGDDVKVDKNIDEDTIKIYNDSGNSIFVEKYLTENWEKLSEDQKKGREVIIKTDKSVFIINKEETVDPNMLKLSPEDIKAKFKTIVEDEKLSQS